MWGRISKEGTEAMKETIILYPKCPKCKKGNLVPLSKKIDGYTNGHNGDLVLPFGLWICIKCGHKIESEDK